MKNHYIILPLVAVTLFAPTALAASNTANFYITAVNAALNPGGQFVANVRIDTDSNNTAINAAQATIQYPHDILEVERIDKTGSIFNFWLQEPVFSNESGQINFIGGAINGVSGKSLHVLKIVFRVKSSGTGNILFSEAAITSNDGSGSNILASVSGPQIISSPQQQVAETVKVAHAQTESKDSTDSKNATASEERTLVSSAANFLPGFSTSLALILGIAIGLALGLAVGRKTINWKNWRN